MTDGAGDRHPNHVTVAELFMVILIEPASNRADTTGSAWRVKQCLRRQIKPFAVVFLMDVI
jgi:hypothetical protein